MSTKRSGGGSRPAPVSLDDLAAPRFPEEVQPILEMMAAMGAELDLDPEVLLHAAEEATGLADFGDDAFRPRLDVLCAALRDEAGLSAMGMTGSFGLLSGLLKNRLLIEDLCRRHPEILEVEIARPIIICGLPRTGTTHLHNLISADPAMRSLPYWESLEPVLAESEQPRAGEPDPRLARTQTAVDVINGTMPYFRRMHEMTVDHVHEEIQLLAIDMSTMLFETTACLPSWRDYYLSHDQTPSYTYLKKILQVMTWLRGGRRWVLKSPQHLEQFGPLVRTFPDATFVVTHRDPASVTVSLATMVSYSARLSVDVTFDRFMADDMAVVEQIYELAEEPMSDTGRRAMEEFMHAHPRGRHGTVRYDPPALGIDPDERRHALRFYSDRFDVRPETV